MKKQTTPSSYGSYGGYGHGIPATGGGRGSNQHHQTSNLPNIFDNLGGGALRLPLGAEDSSGLQLNVKGLENPGIYLPTTVPRERVEIGKRLSSSDSSSDRVRQAVSRLHSQPLKRHSTADGHWNRYNITNPAPGTTTKENIPAVKVRNRSGYKPADSSPLRVPEQLSPSHMIYGGTLPPIGMDVAGCDGDSVQKEDVSSEDIVVGVVSESDTSETSSDDDEEFLETDSEAPPSRPGFESDAEKSAEVFHIPFPDTNISIPFPATMIQEHAQLNTEHYTAMTTTSGLSPRVNNIVRGFHIHGPLDKELLSKALNKIAYLHPILSATFQRGKNRLYVHAPAPGAGESTEVDLSTPLVGHEQPEELILNARRKIFPIDVTSNVVENLDDNGEDEEGLTNTLSLASVGESDLVSANDSPVTKSKLDMSFRKKIVSFARMTPGDNNDLGPLSNPLEKHARLPVLASSLPLQKAEKLKSLLMRARLISKTNTRHILVLSFPRVVCDFWSSCLFMQQLTDLYSKLEKSASYRPSLATRRMENKKHEVISAYERERRNNNSTSTGRRLDAATRLMQKKAQQSKHPEKDVFVPMFPSKLSFNQVAQRENQLLMMSPRERLLAFWEALVMATIKRDRGLNRIKVVPPVRVPGGLGELVPLAAPSRYLGRPQTSRLRPLTASRNRPTTARRQGAGALGEMGASRDALLGPKTKFHFIKIEDEVCEQFKLLLPESCQNAIQQENQLHLFTLGAYVLLLGKCCRGWGTQRHRHTSKRHHVVTTTMTDSRDRPITGRHRDGIQATFIKTKPLPVLADPLKKNYNMLGGRPGMESMTAAEEEHSPEMRGGRKGTSSRLDIGSFLIGVEVSLRDSEPSWTEGLFGPLTNDAAIRVNLSSSETFADLIIALRNSLQLVSKHGHLPFGPVAEEVGLMHGFPIKFSFLRHHDVIQLANPNNYFYVETSIGVVDKGLGRLGSNCYLTPLNSKLDDSSHLELVLWESYDFNASLSGGLRYQPHIISTEFVTAFGEEFCKLLRTVSTNPCAPLLDLARGINQTFPSSRTKARGRRL